MWTWVACFWPTKALLCVKNVAMFREQSRPLSRPILWPWLKLHIFKKSPLSTFIVNMKSALHKCTVCVGHRKWAKSNPITTKNLNFYNFHLIFYLRVSRNLCQCVCVSMILYHSKPIDSFGKQINWYKTFAPLSALFLLGQSADDNLKKSTIEPPLDHSLPWRSNRKMMARVHVDEWKVFFAKSEKYYKKDRKLYQFCVFNRIQPIKRKNCLLSSIFIQPGGRWSLCQRERVCK